MVKTSRLVAAALYFITTLCLAQPLWVSIAKNETRSDSWPSCNVVTAIILVESGGNPHAVNGDAKGLMQVMNAPFDPVKNIKSGIEILRQYYELLGSKVQAVKAYNIGIGNFQQGRLKEAGNRYYNKVANHLQKGSLLCESYGQP